MFIFPYIENSMYYPLLSISNGPGNLVSEAGVTLHRVLNFS